MTHLPDELIRHIMEFRYGVPEENYLRVVQQFKRLLIRHDMMYMRLCYPVPRGMERDPTVILEELREIRAGDFYSDGMYFHDDVTFQNNLVALLPFKITAELRAILDKVGGPMLY